MAVGWVSLFWGAGLGGVHCGGAFWGYFKLTGKTTYLVVRKSSLLCQNSHSDGGKKLRRQAFFGFFLILNINGVAIDYTKTYFEYDRCKKHIFMPYWFWGGCFYILLHANRIPSNGINYI